MDRVYIIQRIIEKLQAKTYLEIGVNKGACFTRIQVDKKIGVDPMDPVDEVKEIANGDTVQYYDTTSDDFFQKHTEHLKKEGIDVAFVDGLHTYKQTLIDIENCLKILNPGGIIVIHDCNPVDECEAVPASSPEEAREIQKKLGLFVTDTWCGDVWKTPVHLLSTRDDLNITVIDCDWGVGIIVPGKKPHKTLDYSAEEIEKMGFYYFNQNAHNLIHIIKPEKLDSFLEELTPLQ